MAAKEVDSANVNADLGTGTGDSDADVKDDSKECTFVHEVLRQSYLKTVQTLGPDEILDVFETERVFGETTDTIVRDIREERKTSFKNREICKLLKRNADIYITFKSALVRTSQNVLLEELEAREKAVHNEMKESRFGCDCADISQCPLISQFKCPEGQTLKFPKEVLDLQRILIELYSEHCRCIPIYLLRPTWKQSVNTLYVRQRMKVVDHRGKREESIRPQRPMSTQSVTDDYEEEKPVTDINDIFYTDGSKCRNIYVTGEAGVGKSTFCEHLVDLWCKAHLSNDGSKLTGDEKCMLEFPLLFYINLSDAKLDLEPPDTDEIALLVKTRLQLADFDICKYLSGGLALVLMDSLDELKSGRMPCRGLRNKSCILTTSRPWKIEVLRSQLEGHIDKQVQIVGLAEKSPAELAENVVGILNKEFNEKKDCYDFLLDMTQRGLKQLVNIPVLLLQMLSLWFDGENFGDSPYEIYTKVVHHQILASVKTKNLPKYAEPSEVKFPLLCNDQDCPCRLYDNLLWKVCKLAYHSLFNENREMSLVFNHEQTKFHGLSTTEVDICLKMGILTQHKLFAKFTQELKSVSFLHKTNQEYFASIYLSDIAQSASKSGPGLSLRQIFDKANKLRQSFRKSNTLRQNVRKTTNLRDIFDKAQFDLDRALELDKILSFTSERNPTVAQELSELIMEKVSSDIRVKIYRGSCEADAMYNDLIGKIQAIILAAARKAPHLYLCDLRLEKDVACVSNLSGLQIKSIAVVSPTDSAWMALVDSLQGLQKLVLSNCKVGAKKIHDIVLRNIQSLKALGLDGGTARKIDLTLLERKLTEIFIVNNLTSLGLSWVNLSHDNIELLFRIFSKRCQLREVRLIWICCTTHGWRSEECACTLDFSRLQKLKKLEIRWGLSAKKVAFDSRLLMDCNIWLDAVSAQISAISSLTMAKDLKLLEVSCLSSQSSVKELVNTLPCLESLRMLVLKEMDSGIVKEITRTVHPQSRIRVVDKNWTVISLPRYQ